MPSEAVAGDHWRQTETTTKLHPAEPENLPCPRCESTNTKFCYYNNYNLSQPRYFCKSCRRYWTRGGTLRNVPVGGGSRKNSKRHRPPAASTPPLSLIPPPLPTTSFSESELMTTSPFLSDHSLNQASLMSLLTATNNVDSRFLALGFGFAPPGFDDADFGCRFGPSVVDNYSHRAGGSDGSMGDMMDDGDYLAWPELAISMPGKGLELE